MIGETRVFAHHFKGLDGSDQPYWRVVGMCDADCEANRDLGRVEPHFNLY